MADLLTTATLAKWTQEDPAVVAVDPFALDLIDKVSQLICFIGGHDGTKDDPASTTIPPAKIPAWDLTIGPTQAPIDVQMVALKVIKRSYQNPDQIVQEGSIGPLGGDKVSDVQALFMDFTDEERSIIARYNIDGDPAGLVDDAGTIFTVRIDRDDSILQTSELYVGDNLQVGLATSADPREWKIPMFNPGDPGDDANYV